MTLLMPEFWLIWGAVAVSTYVAVRRAAEPAAAIFVPVEPVEDIMTDDGMGELPLFKRLTEEEAKAQREAVLADGAANNSEWMGEALGAFEALPYGELGTGEDIRAMLLERGLRAPAHHNTWGALLMTLGRRGKIAKTKEYRPMRSKAAHGRGSVVYVRAAP
jgi:hypothetical protein